MGQTYTFSFTATVFRATIGQRARLALTTTVFRAAVGQRAGHALRIIRAAIVAARAVAWFLRVVHQPERSALDGSATVLYFHELMDGTVHTLDGMGHSTQIIARR